MNQKDQALRIALVAFRQAANGRRFTDKELMNFANLCALALPNKYRLTKGEIASMQEMK